jgi:hypothetical protein
MSASASSCGHSPPTPLTGQGTPVLILAHPGEEVLRPDSPRHIANYNNTHNVAPVIHVNFTANGRLTSGELREHSMTIANNVADIFRQNPTLRRRSRP